jgi:hypothetical protein
MTNTASPQSPGAFQSVADSTALASLTIPLTLGTKVYNAAVAADFTLKVSTASLVTDSVVAVAGIDGLRWIIDQGGSGSIPLSELAAQDAHTFVMNATAGSASPTAADAITATAGLNVATTSLKGLLPNTGVPAGLLPGSLFKSFCSVGADASVTPTHIAATGVKIGDKVVMVANVTDAASSAAAFEATVTVADQIQQATTDLSAKTLVILVIAQS